MFIRYKKSHEKIAMGLLSFMPEEKDLKKLQATMHEYETNDSCQLYLWREDDDIIGLVGVSINDLEDILEIAHISVNPSHRGVGLGTKMVDEISNQFPDKKIVPNEVTKQFISACFDKRDSKSTN